MFINKFYQAFPPVKSLIFFQIVNPCVDIPGVHNFVHHIIGRKNTHIVFSSKCWWGSVSACEQSWWLFYTFLHSQFPVWACALPVPGTEILLQVCLGADDTSLPGAMCVGIREMNTAFSKFYYGCWAHLSQETSLSYQWKNTCLSDTCACQTQLRRQT